MSNEISFSANYAVTNGGYAQALNISDQYNQNALGASAGTQSLTTTYAHIPLGSVSTLGYALLKNLDLTASVQWGLDISAAFVPVGLLKPGEQAIFRLAPGVVPSAKAVSGSPLLQYWVLQD